MQQQTNPTPANPSSVNPVPLPEAQTLRQRRKRWPIWNWLFGPILRIWAFFSKEMIELRRQPLLILSLIGGPLLVLTLFGASYQNTNPVLRTAIVLPPGGSELISNEQIRNLAGINFQITSITEDLAGAEQQLRNNQLDVIQVIPALPIATLQQGQSAEILFRSNAINPMTEGWIRFVAYAEVNEINKALLREQAAVLQQQATLLQQRLRSAQTTVNTLNAQGTPGDAAQTKQDIQETRTLLADIDALLPATVSLAGGEAEIARRRATIQRIQAQLDSLERAIDSGSSISSSAELTQTSADLAELESAIASFVNTPAEVIVAPVREAYENLRGSAYQSVVFFAPGVLALLIQHTAITLGALALVRERLMGAFEVFRVTPATMVQLLIGKYLSYTLFISLAAALMVIAISWLGAPLYPNLLIFSGLIILLTVASLGIGFLISAISRSDSQAVQLAMLSLLLSIFFSGLFIAIESFIPLSHNVSYLIPMTHGLRGFQNMMLRGVSPEPFIWISLAAIALITFLLTMLLTRRQLLRA
jgi:ABC-2 type transport system permease protein